MCYNLLESLYENYFKKCYSLPEKVGGFMRKRLYFGSFYMNGKQLEGSMLADVGSDKNIELYFELPDTIYGFKNCTIDNDTLVIKNREGFTDNDMRYIINIVKSNKKFISEIAEGGKNYAIL
jgi:hypothetical protein